MHRATEHRMGSQSVICHPAWVNASRLTPTKLAGTRCIYPRGIEGWVDLGGRLYTKMVYRSADSRQSK